MKKTIAFYPFLFALYPIITLYSRNPGEIHPSETVRPLLGALVFAWLLLLLVYLAAKDWLKSAFLTALTIFYLSSSGHVYRILKDYVVKDSGSAWLHFVLIAIELSLILVIGSRPIWRRYFTVGRLRSGTIYLNIVSLLALLYPLFSIGTFLYKTRDDALQDWRNFIGLADSPQALRSASQPDIYYLIVDGYGRADVLQEIYHFDNSDFLQYLSQRGFYIASSSQSNYMQTALSLTSSLNLDYLDGLAAQMATADSRAPLLEGLQHSQVRALLEEAGYKSVVVANVWLFTDIRDAQLYLTPYPHALPAFEEFWLGNSILPLFTNSLHQQMSFPSYDTHRKYVTYSLDALAEVAAVPGPKFVFAHILAPHPPFVFDRTGQPVNPSYTYFLGDASGYQGTQEEYLTGYVDEVIYINQRLETTLDAILSKSAKPPVIILQGDHGPGMYTNVNSADETCMKERFSILNAYYLPGGTDPLYPAITPVNSFRLIFDKYFQTQLGFLPDKQYFSTRQYPY